MKRKLLPADWGKLAKALQGLYKKTEKEGKTVYILEIEDDEEEEEEEEEEEDDSADADTAATRAKKREKEARKKAQDELKALKKELRDLKKAKEEEEEGDARNKGDVTALEASWKKKLADKEAELQGKLDAYKGQIRKLLVEAEAERMVKDIGSTAPKALKRIILDRLDLEEDDEGNFEIRVLDSNGKASAADLKELRKEIVSDKELSGIITGSKASGGSAAGGGGAGGRAAFNIKDYQNEDGSVNWTSVANAEAKSPGVLKSVKVALGQETAPASE